GIITWIFAMFLVLCGMSSDYIQQVAENKAPGGGPAEAALRLFQRKPQAAPLEESPTTSLARSADDVSRWGMRLFLKILPDVDRYDLHQYVAEGFDISWSQVLFLDNLWPLLGYLLPWALLAFYLMRF